MKNNWYVAKNGNDFQGLVIEENTGRNVAVTYDPKDAPLIVALSKLPQVVENIMGLLVEGLTDTQNEAWDNEIYELLKAMGDIVICEENKANGIH